MNRYDRYVGNCNLSPSFSGVGATSRTGRPRKKASFKSFAELGTISTLTTFSSGSSWASAAELARKITTVATARASFRMTDSPLEEVEPAVKTARLYRLTGD